MMIIFNFNCIVLGEFRGPAHNICNLQYRVNSEKIKIPCIIHNLKNYDAHLIMSAVKPRHGEITCIPTTDEKYITFTIGGVTFIDSFQFMLSSLDKLSSNLNNFPETEKYVKNLIVKEEEELNELAEILANLPDDSADDDDDGDDADDDDDVDSIHDDFINHDEEGEQQNNISNEDYRTSPYNEPPLSNEQSNLVKNHLKLMTRKGVYPYSYCDNFEVFKESTLPDKNSFYNTLNDSHISDKDYEHAQDVFTTLKMSSLREYHDFYLLCDVLLLSDVFETFRDTCMSFYKLDPAHFFTAPGLSWQAALKMTDVKLELITDIDLHLFIEAGIRGGVSTITRRFAKSNIPGEAEYDPEQPPEHLIYWDANNLYGWAMSQYLPICGFHWLDCDEINSFDVNRIGDTDDVGYILEVDLGKTFY